MQDGDVAVGQVYRDTDGDDVRILGIEEESADDGCLVYSATVLVCRCARQPVYDCTSTAMWYVRAEHLEPIEVVITEDPI